MSYIVTQPEFVMGQPVTCILFPGVWVVSHITKVDLGFGVNFRYQIRNGEIYQDNIIQIWLEPWRSQRPNISLATENKFMKQRCLTEVRSRL